MLEVVGAFSGFSVDDMEKAHKFYEDTLGLEVESSEMGLQLHLPGGAEVFVYPKADHEAATFTVLNLEVENIDDAVAALEGKGVEFEDYADMTDDKHIARGLSRNQGPDIAWFKDPAGNIVSVLQGE